MQKWDACLCPAVYNPLMSKQLLNNYYNKLDETIRFGGSRNETTVEHAFIQLVDSYAGRRNLRLVKNLFR